jgi:TP901 family phage tail tape measure protein
VPELVFVTKMDDRGKVATELVKIQTNLDELAVKSQKSASGFVKAMKGMEDAAMQVGKYSAVIAAPFVLIGGYAMNAASEFKKAMNIVRVTTGATGQDLKNYGAIVRDIFSKEDESLQDVAIAFGEMKQRSGLAGEALKAMTITMLEFADVSGMDVGSAIRLTSRLFGDWSIATEKQSDALNTLLRVSQLTRIDMGHLSQLMTDFGVPMRMLGLTFEQTAIMFGKFEREGVNVEMVVASLGRSLSAFNRMGIKPGEGLQQAIADMKTGTLKQATDLAKKLVGGRPGVAENFAGAAREGRLDLEPLLKLLAASTDTIAKAKEETKTFTDRLTEMKNAVEAAFIPLGAELNVRLNATFIPLMRDMAATIVNLVAGFNALPGGVKDGVIAFGAVASALAVGAPMFGFWIVGVLKLAAALKVLAVAAAAHPIVLLGVTLSTAAFLGVTKWQDRAENAKAIEEAKASLAAGIAGREKTLNANIKYLNSVGVPIPSPAIGATMADMDNYEVLINKIYAAYVKTVPKVQLLSSAHKQLTGTTMELAQAHGALSNAKTALIRKTLAELQADSESTKARDEKVKSFKESQVITETELGAMKVLEAQGVPVWKMYEMVSAKMDKITESSDPLIKKLLEMKAAMGTGKEAYELSVKLAEAEGKIQSIFLNRGQAKFDVPGPKTLYVPSLEEWQAEQMEKTTAAQGKFAEALYDNVANFKNYRNELTLTIGTINQLAVDGEDLRLIYEQFGGVLENQPEMLSKATTKILEQGKMLSIINDGWKNIGKTIETSISGAFSDMLSHAKTLKDALAGIWDSIKRSFTDMLGAMVSAFMMRFLTPILTQIRGQATGTGSLAGGMASMIPSMVMGGGATGGYPMGAYGGGIIGSQSMGGPSLVNGVYTAGGAGSGGRMSALGGALGPYGIFGGTMGASLGGNYLGGVMGGGTAGSILGMAAGGIGGAFAGAGIAGAMGIGTASMSGLLAAMGGTVVLAPIVAAIAAAALINHLYKSPADRAAQETHNDFGGINMTTKTFEQFAASLGLGKRQYEGIRKDLTSSPKFLTEIAYPLAQQQGKMTEFLKSLEAVSTAWGTFNFRTAFEAWVKTGNSDALNKAFTSAFATSQALQQNLPDWRNVLAASGAAGSSTSPVRLPINRPITTTPVAPVTPSPIITPTARPVPQQIIFSPTINAVDGADVTRVMRDKLFPAFIDMLKNNTASSRQQLTQVLT